MANRYWVGGSGTWDTTSTTNWSASSGGGSGASVPTNADSVFFDQAGTYTVTCTGALTSLDFTVSAGTVTFATGTSPSFNIRGSLSLLAGTVWNPTSTITFSATTTGNNVTTNGTTLSGAVSFNGSGGGWTLGSALTIGSSSTLSINQGTFNTANYAITCGVFNSNSTSTRTLNLGSSTITFGVTVSGGIFLLSGTGLTFNAGTSTFTSAQSSATFAGGGNTFYNLTLSNTTVSSSWAISGANTFNNLTIPGMTTLGIRSVSFFANQTINGTLSLGASTGAPYRTFLSSNLVGTQRTLTCAAISSVTDVDFADINFAGAISLPVTGTRLGDCKNNNNITFPAAKTVYYRQTGNNSWGTATNGSWSATSGGALDATMFPLAQDTAVFPAATYPASGLTATINAAYNIGTIDMSLRTSNTMTLATGTQTPTIYGNWINGTGITLSGSGRISFSGQTTQTITSVGRGFSQPFTIDAGSGSVTLQDAFSTSITSTTAILLTSGTFNANGYNVTLSSTGATGVSISGTITRTLAIGSGTWTIAGTTGWIATITSNLTVTGTGTISLTSASAKTFTGGGISYSSITLNQGGAGDLTITGSNTFGDITNTVQPATVLFTAGTTSTFSNFSLSGTAGNLITVGSVTAASHTLSKTSGTVSRDFLSISRSTATGGALWYAGANSTNGGNNTGWIFTAPPSGYTAGGQFFAFF